MSDFGTIECMHDGTAMAGFVIRQADASGALPAIIMFPGASGWGAAAKDAARELAAFGYLVIGANIFPAGADVSTDDAIVEQMTKVFETPGTLRARAHAWHRTVLDLPDVDAGRIAALGFCLGGKCVIELARGGAALKAVVSFHGLLTTHAPAAPGSIKARVVAWCAGKDPYAPIEQVDDLRRELEVAGADYQIMLFSDAQHSFTNPDNDGRRSGIAYDPLAHHVSWQGTLALLDQLLHP